jgi:voltage-gated potassium channel Kch
LFGYKKGGAEFVKVFKSLDKRYVVIDYDPEVIEMLEQKDVPFLYGDATDIELLEEANISNSKLIISIVSDANANSFLIDWVNNNNPHAVVICAADNPQQAIELYQAGASYVMLPHYIGSEKIGAFIKKSNLSKTEFKHYREKHLTNLLTKFDSENLT